MHVLHAAQRGVELNLWYSVKVKIEKCCENIIYRKHIHSWDLISQGTYELAEKQ